MLHDVWTLRFARPGGNVTPTAPRSVTPLGPALGVINTTYTFTATVNPITATSPMTYVWTATGLASQTHTGRGASDTATFVWPAAGAKVINISATNQAGTAQNSYTLLISETPIIFNHGVYLPLIKR